MVNRLFGTDGMRGRVNQYPLTAETVLRLGLSAGTIFRKKGTRQKVIIGKDTRLSGYMFESALTAGFCAMGLDVYQVGPLPTPAIAFLVQSMRADFGVVISASHNPFYDNGIKFFDNNGFKLPDSLEDEIQEIITNKDYEWKYPAPEKVGRAFRIVDASGRYIVYLKSAFPQKLTLEGLRIVLDCANGANYKIAPLALEELGAEVFCIGNKPDGLNINLQSGSLFPEALQDRVREVRADIGLALDGDADRLLVVDEKGNILHGDHFLAICANDMISKNKLKNNILVGTTMSNLALQNFMESKGGSLIRADVGDRYVIEEMLKYDASLGGEQSGHIIFRDYCTTGDGLLAALQLLRIMCETKKSVSELSQILKLYPQHLENVKISKKIPFEDCPKLQEIKKSVEDSLSDTGRVLIRYSGTENLCRVMVEDKDEELARNYAKQIADVVRAELQ